jgi:hypothetical protein
MYRVAIPVCFLTFSLLAGCEKVDQAIGAIDKVTTTTEKVTKNVDDIKKNVLSPGRKSPRIGDASDQGARKSEGNEKEDD